MTTNETNSEFNRPGEEKASQTRALRMLLYLAIFSMVMFFAGLTSAYVVLMKGEFWVDIKLPQAFLYSSVIIVASSIAMIFAVRAAKNSNSAMTRTMLGVALTLGLAFAWSQFQGWGQLIDSGNFVSGSVENIKGEYGTDYSVFFKGKELVLEDGKYYFPDDKMRDEPLNDRVLRKSNTASSFIYALSGLHLLHLAGGLIYLVYLMIRSIRTPYTAQNNLSLRQGATYWHFLDILWLYLYLFLLFIH